MTELMIFLKYLYNICFVPNLVILFKNQRYYFYRDDCFLKGGFVLKIPFQHFLHRAMQQQQPPGF